MSATHKHYIALCAPEIPIIVKTQSKLMLIGSIPLSILDSIRIEDYLQIIRVREHLSGGYFMWTHPTKHRVIQYEFWGT
jgi:hypothetical protein